MGTANLAAKRWLEAVRLVVHLLEAVTPWEQVAIRSVEGPRLAVHLPEVAFALLAGVDLVEIQAWPTAHQSSPATV